MPAATLPASELDETKFGEGFPAISRFAVKRSANRFAVARSFDELVAAQAPIAAADLPNHEFKPVQSSDFAALATPESLRPAPDNDNVNFQQGTTHKVLLKGFQNSDTVAVQYHARDPRLLKEIKQLLAATKEFEISLEINEEDPNSLYRSVYKKIGSSLPEGAEYFPLFLRSITERITVFAQQTGAKTINLRLSSHGTPVKSFGTGHAAELMAIFSEDGMDGGEVKQNLTLEHGLGNSSMGGSGANLAGMQPEGKRYILLHLATDAAPGSISPAAAQNLAVGAVIGPMIAGNFASMNDIGGLPGKKRTEEIAYNIMQLEAAVEAARHPDTPDQLREQVQQALPAIAAQLANPATIRDVPIATAIEFNKTVERLATDPQLSSSSQIAQAAIIAQENIAVLITIAPPALRQEMGIITPVSQQEYAQALNTLQGQAIAIGQINRAQHIAQLPPEQTPIAVTAELPLAQMQQMAVAFAGQSVGNQHLHQQLIGLQQTALIAQQPNPPLSGTNQTLDLASYQTLKQPLAALQQALTPELMAQWPAETAPGQVLLQLYENPPQTPMAVRQAIVNLARIAPQLNQTSTAALIDPAASQMQQAFKTVLQAVVEPATPFIAADVRREDTLRMQAAVNAAMHAAPDNTELQMAAINLQKAVQNNTNPAALDDTLKQVMPALKKAAKQPGFKEQAPDLQPAIQEFERQLNEPVNERISRSFEGEARREHFQHITGQHFSDFTAQALAASPPAHQPQIYSNLLNVLAAPAMAIAATGIMAADAMRPSNFVTEANRYHLYTQLNNLKNSAADTSAHIQQAAQIFTASVIQSFAPQQAFESQVSGMQALLATEPTAAPLQTALAQVVQQVQNTPPVQQAAQYLTALDQAPQQVAAMRNEVNAAAQIPTPDPLNVRDVVQQNIRQIEQALAAAPDNIALQAVHKALMAVHGSIDPSAPQSDGKTLAGIEAHLQTLETLLKVAATYPDDPTLQAAQQILLQQIAKDIAKTAGVETQSIDPAALITNKNPLAANTATTTAAQPITQVQLSGETSPEAILAMLNNPNLSPELRTYLLAEFNIRKQQALGIATVGSIIYKNEPINESMSPADLLRAAFDPNVHPDRKAYAQYLWQLRQAETLTIEKEKQAILLQQQLDQQNAAAQAELERNKQEIARLEAEKQQFATQQALQQQSVAMVASNNAILAANQNFATAQNIVNTTELVHTPVVTQHQLPVAVPEFNDSQNKPEKLYQSPVNDTGLSTLPEEWVTVTGPCGHSVRVRKGEEGTAISHCTGRSKISTDSYTNQPSSEDSSLPARPEDQQLRDKTNPNFLGLNAGQQPDGFHVSTTAQDQSHLPGWCKTKGKVCDGKCVGCPLGLFTGDSVDPNIARMGNNENTFNFNRMFRVDNSNDDLNKKVAPAATGFNIP